MNALCQELLLPGPAVAGNEDSHGLSSENLAVGQSLLLTEASVVGTETAGVEIFVEAVADAISLSNPDNTTEVLVKVVELYFCERCGQSFSDPSLLSQHQCVEISRRQLASIPQLQGLPLALTSQDLPVAGEQPTVPQTPMQNLLDGSRQDLEHCSDPLLCPVCQVEFALPAELKEHFKDHNKSQGAQVCPVEDCHFSSEDRKQLRGHLRHIHQVSPVACTYRGCPILFQNREDMEFHRKSHFPFHCGRCDFVSANTKQFGLHRHSHLQEATQQGEAATAVLEMRADSESAEHSFTAAVGKELTDHLLLSSGRAEVIQKAENSLKTQSDWEVTEMETSLGAHAAHSDVHPEDMGTLAKEDSPEIEGDEILEEEERDEEEEEEEEEGQENFCKEVSSELKVSQVQLLKGGDFHLFEGCRFSNASLKGMQPGRRVLGRVLGNSGGSRK